MKESDYFQEVVLWLKLASLFNCVVKINDWIFSHAGILPEKLIPCGEGSESITRLNEDVRDYFRRPLLSK